jgi:hypothetical protein
MRVSLRSGVLVLALVLGMMAPAGRGEEAARNRVAVQSDRVIAGGERDFMEVRHLVLKGTNEEIGRALAAIARERHRSGPLPSQDRLRTRAQRRYIERNYPILYERMGGVAAAFGRRLEDDSLNFSGLSYGLFGAGCSVVHFPPTLTASGSSIVSRDYDFTTGKLQGTWPAQGEMACTASPYVIEMHPEQGYASLALCSYDLLSGVLDGINSEGLTVALLADDELMMKYRMEPAGMEGVGLGVLQVLRMLLDTCANVDEAKEALLLTKQYYEFIPVHYLVADRQGHSFVWEYSQAHNREFIVEHTGKPLITTNFSLHSYLDGHKPPSAQRAQQVCPRYCALAEHLMGKDKLTVDFIKETHKIVDATRPSPKGAPRPPHRTLWHALYFPEQRKVQVSFYLRDEPDKEASGKTRIVRSEYLEFTLDKGKGVKD